MTHYVYFNEKDLKLGDGYCFSTNQFSEPKIRNDEFTKRPCGSTKISWNMTNITVNSFINVSTFLILNVDLI